MCSCLALLLALMDLIDGLGAVGSEQNDLSCWIILCTRSDVTFFDASYSSLAWKEGSARLRPPILEGRASIFLSTCEQGGLPVTAGMKLLCIASSIGCSNGPLWGTVRHR